MLTAVHFCPFGSVTGAETRPGDSRFVPEKSRMALYDVGDRRFTIFRDIIVKIHFRQCNCCSKIAE